MPRRNILFLCTVAIVSLACYQKANSRYGRMYDTFSEVLGEIDKHYVDQVSNRELFEGSLKGLVRGLDDPNSFYLSPDEAERSRSSLDQQFGGIGIEIDYDPVTKLITVLNPIVGTPAYEHGVLPGDKILKIDGESAEGILSQDAMKRLRGEPGKPVTITLLREGAPEPIDITLKRAIINVKSVLGDYHKPDGQWQYFLPGTDHIAYVRVTQFGEKTFGELETVLQQLDREGMKGLILDLRNNVGGLLEAAVKTCDLFVTSGSIVSTRGRDKQVLKNYSATGQAIYPQLPIVVLINSSSASASEIVASCLQDHGRALVMGERSYGKGTVQSVIPIEGGRSELRLTIATYWRPSEKNIHRGKKAKETDEWGVTPDPKFAFDLDKEALTKLGKARRERDRIPSADAALPDAPLESDPVLFKAVEELKGRSASDAVADRTIGTG